MSAGHWLVSHAAAVRGWGLLHNVELPPALAIAIAVILLDLAIYLQHAMFHAWPVLWRLHAVHHADVDFDVTTGTRFHPVEIALSMATKVAAVLLIGAVRVRTESRSEASRSVAHRNENGGGEGAAPPRIERSP